MDIRIKPDRLQLDPHSPDARKDFTHWLACFEAYINAADPAPTEAQKINVLYSRLSSSVFPLIQDATTYTKAMELLKEHYAQKANTLFARHVLATRSQLPGMLHEGEVYHETTTKLFIYEFSQKPEFVDYWSAVKVKINSSELLELTYPAKENRFDEQTVIHLYHQNRSPSKSLASEFIISIECYDRKTFFKVKPVVPHTKYMITVTKRPFEPKLIFLFVAGIILFLFARRISRSEKFYYCAGITLGIVAILVLILLVCRRLLQKRTFLLLQIPSWSASVFLIYLSIVNLSQVRKYLIGYLFVVGCLSYAICHRHGPLSNERSINLLTWTLQLAALVLIYCGVTCSQCAYTAIAILLCANNLHHPVNLIQFIFRLADFILGANDLTQEEVQNHEQQYGFGGSFLEDQLFVPEENNGLVLENGEVMAASEEHEVDAIMN
ncbi:nuclear envelope integral membrane protein 1a-like isoform X2 [Scyliorhinus torazame]|uniref:nuclear envelope integral membrane protein 1a-like isoform X2 n=1 Tax=Scyliorhinus torazame TaxID=75743 RepID=UPI003B5C8E78